VNEQTLRYWVGFNCAKGIGPIWFRKLVEHFGDVETAWRAPSSTLRALGLPERALHSLLTTRTNCDLDAQIRAIERCGAHVVTLQDDEYPQLLRQIPDAPPVLYIRGAFIETDRLALAVIGTRRATAYGKEMARTITESVASAGVTIVSGLARGIDAIAHETAVEVGGRTIAVLPSGIDIIYPPEHHELAESVVAHGALITELPLGEPAERNHFAPRNRILGGLALGTLIIEAAEKSGALMTADAALEQGRDVFAVPGNALSPASKGTNALIQSGAQVVTSASDVLNALNVQQAINPMRKTKVSSSSSTMVVKPENDAEAAILECLSTDPQHIDVLARCTNLPVSKINSILTIFEVKGIVRQIGILQYALT
jgi:DNA processing protein